jgi:two-component system, OmpR family, sensor histidine kinase KdpD
MSHRQHPALAYAWSFVAAGLATGVAFALDGFMSVAGLAMVYLVATVLCALVLDRAPALLASLACVCALNYFFVPPRYTFEVDGAEYWWILAVLLATSAAVGTLVASLREGVARAELGERRLAELHSLAEELAQCSGAEAMAQRAAQWLEHVLQRSSAVFLSEADEARPLRHWGAPESAPYHDASARWALEHGRPLGRGCDDWPDLPLWCAPFARHGAMGAVQVLVHPADRPDADVLDHWKTLAQQVGLSIERERASAAARLAEEAARAEAARNTLLASLSHDLRTPLAGILGTATTLRCQADQLPAAQREKLLANIESETRDLAAMADNVLQLARLSQPHAQLRLEWEAMEEVLGAAVARMRGRWPDARIQLRVMPSLPPLKAEAALLAQVIANLVDNAVRHSKDEPRIEITAGRSRDGVFVAVRDHGEGIAQEETGMLFERYRQGVAGHTGTAGLGLAICQLVVQAHGGRIVAKRCEPGTEFRIDLPAQQAQQAAE